MSEASPTEGRPIAERLREDADIVEAWDKYELHGPVPPKHDCLETAKLEREAAAEIARLRARVAELERKNIDFAAEMTAQLINAVAEGRAAGIEEAAQWHDFQAKQYPANPTRAQWHENAATTLRALKDKPDAETPK